MYSPCNHGLAIVEKEVEKVAHSDSTPNKLENGGISQTPWSPGRQEWKVMTILALASLPVALDSTILVTVLPVGLTLLSSLPTQQAL